MLSRPTSSWQGKRTVRGAKAVCNNPEAGKPCTEHLYAAVSVDEVYALEELFKSLSNSIHRVRPVQQLLLLYWSSWVASLAIQHTVLYVLIS